MSIGMVALVIVTVLTLFGVSSRVFDGMYLSDKGALMFIAAMFVLGLVPEVPLGDHIKINPFQLLLHGINRQLQTLRILQDARNVTENNAWFREIRNASDIIFYGFHVVLQFHCYC
mgnify:CR=1 FL=1